MNGGQRRRFTSIALRSFRPPVSSRRRGTVARFCVNLRELGARKLGIAESTTRFDASEAPLHTAFPLLELDLRKPACWNSASSRVPRFTRRGLAYYYRLRGCGVCRQSPLEFLRFMLAGVTFLLSVVASLQGKSIGLEEFRVQVLPCLQRNCYEDVARHQRSSRSPQRPSPLPQQLNQQAALFAFLKVSVWRRAGPRSSRRKFESCSTVTALPTVNVSTGEPVISVSFPPADTFVHRPEDSDGLVQ